MATTRPRLREARRAAGLTQTELGACVGVDQTVIARWESGDREPRVMAAVRIAEALDTTVNALWPVKPTRRTPVAEREAAVRQLLETPLPAGEAATRWGGRP